MNHSDRSCIIDGCMSVAIARGWCSIHYQRWRKNGNPLVGARKTVAGMVCSVGGCDRPVDSRGWCQTHYVQWRRTGATGHQPRREVDLRCGRCGRDRLPNPAGRLVCRPCNIKYLRRYYAENAEHLRADARARAASDRDAGKRRTRRYYNENPLVFLAGNHRRRARQRDAVCEHGPKCVTPSFLLALRNRTCIYCPSPAAHADHYVPLARGGLHCRENLVPACEPCNRGKHALMPNVWRARLIQLMKEQP